MPTDHATALKRFNQAKTYWSDIRAQCVKDLRYRTGDQWDPDIKSDRENDERFPRPALTFNELATIVQNTTNKARKDRPQPRVGPGDGGNQETADYLEGRLRHIFYASQADVAFDHGVEYGAGCGFGVYRVIKQKVGKRGRYEPRVKRILDPLTALYVWPGVQEADFSDAKWWFVLNSTTERDDFRNKFGVDPVPFEEVGTLNLGDTKDTVPIAEYWELEEDKDGTRHVYCSVMDSARFLPGEEHTPWEGDWIPLIPVLGQELVVEGKRLLISLIRDVRDTQKLLNAVGSNLAASASQADGGHYLAQAGTIKHRHWTDGKKHLWYEYEPLNSMGQPSQPPVWQDPEPAIQALTQTWFTLQDQIKRGVGYQDNVLQMAKTPLSGVAVDRREEQQDTINYHFEDNLVRSQWHCARVLIDLDRKWTVTSGVLPTRGEDGKTAFVPVAVGGELLPDHEPDDHIVLDLDAEYHVVAEPSKSYASKISEEIDRLIEIMRANPALMPLYLDRLFALLGYQDLEKRARQALPPQIAQAEDDEKQGISPREQALQNQVRQLQMLLQQVGMKLASKQVEQQGRLAVETTKQHGEITRDKLKLIASLMQTHQEHAHEHGQMMADHRLAAIQHLLDFIKDSEMGPDPNAPLQPTGAAA